MMVLKSQKPRKSENIIQKKVGKESLLYDSKSKSVHVLNSTSSFIWELCDGRNDVEMIEMEVKNRFDVTKENNVINDIYNTLNEFKELGLVEFKT